MIPEFPKFKKIELSDRYEVEKITKKFRPHSDFNFFGLWSWDVNGEKEISLLNGNLVARLSNYDDGPLFYSFLGEKYVNETAKTIIEFAKNCVADSSIHLVHEDMLPLFDENQFSFSDDENNFDYILSVESLSTFAGNKLGPKRNFVNRFRRTHESTTKIFQFDDDCVRGHIEKVFDSWVLQKGMNPHDAEAEHQAIIKLLGAGGVKSLFVVGIFVEEQLVGFTINEMLDNEFAVLHFEKAHANNHVGIFQYLMLETAKYMSSLNIKYLNYEQDLGIVGLRKHKQSYYPACMLKKFTITEKK